MQVGSADSSGVLIAPLSDVDDGEQGRNAAAKEEQTGSSRKKVVQPVLELPFRACLTKCRNLQVTDGSPLSEFL